jgi:hypothetical protein
MPGPLRGFSASWSPFLFAPKPVSVLIESELDLDGFAALSLREPVLTPGSSREQAVARKRHEVKPESTLFPDG